MPPLCYYRATADTTLEVRRPAHATVVVGMQTGLAFALDPLAADSDLVPNRRGALEVGRTASVYYCAHGCYPTTTVWQEKIVDLKNSRLDTSSELTADDVIH